jgi:hypothetical protein
MNKGRVVSRQEDAKSITSTLRPQEQQLQLVLQDHPIAPTEFPKGWSTVQLVRH